MNRQTLQELWAETCVQYSPKGKAERNRVRKGGWNYFALIEDRPLFPLKEMPRQQRPSMNQKGAP